MPRFPQFANGGAICLDETGELPRSLQAKLLDPGEVHRDGGHQPLRAEGPRERPGGL